VADAKKYCDCLNKAKESSDVLSEIVGCYAFAQEIANKYENDHKNALKFTQEILKCGNIDNIFKGNETVEKPEVTTFKMNQEVKYGNYVITVTNLLNPYKSNNPFDKPKIGNKFVAVEVLYYNDNTINPIKYMGIYDWTLIDDEGYSYSSEVMLGKELALKEPASSSGTINPNSKVKGWITFETLKEAKNFKITFNPGNSDLDNTYSYNIEFLLF